MHMSEINSRKIGKRAVVRGILATPLVVTLAPLAGCASPNISPAAHAETQDKPKEETYPPEKYSERLREFLTKYLRIKPGQTNFVRVFEGMVTIKVGKDDKGQPESVNRRIKPENLESDDSKIDYKDLDPNRKEVVEKPFVWGGGEDTWIAYISAKNGQPVFVWIGDKTDRYMEFRDSEGKVIKRPFSNPDSLGKQYRFSGVTYDQQEPKIAEGISVPRLKAFDLQLNKEVRVAASHFEPVK